MTKHPYTGSQSLSSAVDSLTRPIFAKRGALEARLLSDWRLIVGEKLASYTIPERISFKNNETSSDGVLHLGVTNSSIATEMAYLTPMLLEKITLYLGCKAIARLKLHLRPIKHPETLPVEKPIRPLQPAQAAQLDALIGEVDDPELREVLRNLGEGVMRQGE